MGIWVGWRVDGLGTKDLTRIACIVDVVLVFAGDQITARCSL